MCWEAIAILKSDFAGDDRCGRKQAHDGERCDRFSGAGFPDQSKNFAGGDGERKTANGGHRCSRPRRLAGRECPASTRLRELDGQVADVEQRAHEGYGISGDATLTFSLLQSSLAEHLEELFLRAHVDRLRYQLSFPVVDKTFRNAFHHKHFVDLPSRIE